MPLMHPKGMKSLKPAIGRTRYFEGELSVCSMTHPNTHVVGKRRQKKREKPSGGPPGSYSSLELGAPWPVAGRRSEWEIKAPELGRLGLLGGDATEVP